MASFSVVLVVMLGMLAVPLLSDGGVRVRVPSLHGLTRAAIGAKLGRAHLRFAFRSRHSFARRGTAVGQRPARGMRVSEGSVVIATLSAGPPPVAVPRIVGFSSSDARSSLHQLGLHASSQEVPAPGVIPGTVTAQSPSPGVKLRRGSTVSLSVAESPRWRDVATFTDQDGEASAPFRIQGARWRIVYRMAYIGTCTFIFFCSGPTAHVTDVGRGTTVSTFDLGDGTDQVRTFGAGPGPYQVKVTPGEDSTRWSAEIQDYY